MLVELWRYIVGWKSYEAYLRSMRWRYLRKQALKRDGKACRVCASTECLEVHHRKYPKVLGRESVKDLCVLCARCHRLFHGV